MNTMFNYKHILTPFSCYVQYQWHNVIMTIDQYNIFCVCAITATY